MCLFTASGTETVDNLLLTDWILLTIDGRVKLISNDFLNFIDLQLIIWDGGDLSFLHIFFPNQLELNLKRCYYLKLTAAFFTLQ